MTAFLVGLGIGTLIFSGGLLVAFVAAVCRDTWRERQLRKREVRALLRSIETVKR